MEARQTKQTYIEAHPRSILVQLLGANDWPNETPIEIIGGQVAPDTKTSNLFKALQRSKRKQYVVGARRQRQSEGYIIAVA